MKMLFIFFIVGFYYSIYSQTTLPEAREKWSKPEKIQAIQDFRWGSNQYPCVSWDGKTIYFNSSAIYYTRLTDTGWSFPQKLPDQLNYPTFKKKPLISPDGNQFLFEQFSTGQIYRSYWNDTLNDWDTARVLRDNGIGSGWGRWSLGNFLDDTTLILLQNDEGRITYYNKEIKIFSSPQPFPSEPLPIMGALGHWVSPDRRKWYKGTGTSYNTFDIEVSYFIDSTGGFGLPFRLNISYLSDSLFNINEIKGKNEYFPFLTPDRKLMYYMANYDSGFGTTIYVSKMIVDENGDTVLTNIRDDLGLQQPKDINLFPAYPNPFNPTTTIQYSLNENGFVSLIVYDVLGRELATLVNEYKNTGIHSINFDAGFLPSGVYVYRLNVNNFSAIKKMIVLK